MLVVGKLYISNNTYYPILIASYNSFIKVYNKISLRTHLNRIQVKKNPKFQQKFKGNPISQKPPN